MVSTSKELVPGDRDIIENILNSSGFFYDFEIEIALGLVDDTLAYGTDVCSYHWMKLYDNGEFTGFANYVKNSFSVHSWDLYWIAIRQNARNKKLGSILLRSVEEDIRNLGGKILWLDTSGRPLYESTEKFYIGNGYTLQASLKDYYGPGDPKQVYSKVL